MKMHPHAALLADPLLWDAWTEWRFGQREIQPRDFRRMSNFELETRAVLMAADNRAQLRRMRRGETEDGDA